MSFLEGIDPELSDVVRSWDQILEAIKIRKRSLYAWVLMAAPEALDGDGVLTLAFRSGYRFHAENTVREDSASLVLDAIADVTGFHLAGIRAVVDGEEIIGQTKPPTMEASTTAGDPANPDEPVAVFIVHGRNEVWEGRFFQALTKLKLAPIVLKEEPHGGRTLIEKFEQVSAGTKFACVLLTADDEGRLQGDDALQPRARQNVILELGYFIGAVGRENVAVFYEPDVEMPSDLSGVGYHPLDHPDGWKLPLLGELRHAGIPVDANLL